MSGSVSGVCPRCRHRPHAGVCGYLPDDEVEPYRCQCSLTSDPARPTLPDYRAERERFTRLLNDLLDVYRPAGLLIWLGSQNRHLDGQMPRELIASGTDDDWARLLNEADRIASW